MAVDAEDVVDGEHGPPSVGDDVYFVQPRDGSEARELGGVELRGERARARGGSERGSRAPELVVAGHLALVRGEDLARFHVLESEAGAAVEAEHGEMAERLGHLLLA